MNKPLALAAVAALLFAPAAIAQDAEATSAEERATPVRLLAFEGGQQFLATSSRLRIVRHHIGYTLEVDAAGKVTDCRIKDEFSRTYINSSLCEILAKYHSFEPAHDASGAAVPGTYTARIDYADLRESL